MKGRFLKVPVGEVRKDSLPGLWQVAVVCQIKKEVILCTSL